MKAIHPNLFTQVMRLPAHVRAEILEFLGATPVEDAQLRQMLADVYARPEAVADSGARPAL